MPYITCSNGKTYSRYSADPYVRECISVQNTASSAARDKCLLDEECRGELNIIATGIVVLVIILFVLLYLCLKDIGR